MVGGRGGGFEGVFRYEGIGTVRFLCGSALHWALYDMDVLDRDDFTRESSRGYT